MIPAASSRRTRSKHGRGVNPTVSASFRMVERPSRWSALNILTSIPSNPGGRLGTMAGSIEGGLVRLPVNREPATAVLGSSAFLPSEHDMPTRPNTSAGGRVVDDSLPFSPLLLLFFSSLRQDAA